MYRSVGVFFMRQTRRAQNSFSDRLTDIGYNIFSHVYRGLNLKHTDAHNRRDVLVTVWYLLYIRCMADH